MLRIALSCLLLVTLTNCLYQSPFCQNWCYRQRTIVQPQFCNTHCGGYTANYGACCPGQTGYPPYPVVYQGAPTAGWPGIQYPNPGPIVIVDPSQPLVRPNNEQVKVVVDTTRQRHLEWVCPSDPQPRAGTISGTISSGPVLVACQHDENCANAPQRSKCCFDSGVGMTVCKPAILA